MTDHAPQLRTLASATAVSQAAAMCLADQLRANPRSVLLLPTGRTMLQVYAALIEIVYAEQLDLAQVHTFNLDEFYGLAPSHPGSYRSYMQQALFDHVNIPPAQIDLIDGSAADIVAECTRYEAHIEAVGGIDLAMLGIGVNGHIGFNEPGSSFTSRTRLVTLRDTSRSANADRFNDDAEAVPREAATVGIATIMAARRILLLATGASKAPAIHALLHGSISPDLPASALRQHPDVTVLIDQAAAALPL